MRKGAVAVLGIALIITVISSVAIAQTSVIEITQNGGFDTSPNGWVYQYEIYYGNGTAVSVWVPSILGRSGVVVLDMDLYNPVGGPVSGSTYLLQNVTFPSNSPISVTLNISYYGNYSRSLGAVLYSFYLFAELLYPNGTVAWSSTQAISPGIWSNVSFTIPTANVTPGETYVLVVGAGISGYIFNLLGAGYINMSLYLDCAHLYVEIKENSSDALGGSAVKGSGMLGLLIWLPVLAPVPVYYIRKKKKGMSLRKG